MIRLFDMFTGQAEPALNSRISAATTNPACPRTNDALCIANKKEELPIRFLDMFSGIGGFRSGLEMAGGYVGVGFCEKDKYAQAAYRTLYHTAKEYFSDEARTIEPGKLPEFDLLCAGFPCQPF